MPPKKGGRKPKGPILAPPIPKGFSVSALMKNGDFTVQDKLGSGGFGTIYFCKKSGEKSANYAIKLEPQDNGPLYCEQHCYLNILRPKMLESYLKTIKKADKIVDYVPLPEFIGHGITKHSNIDLRFLVIPLYHGGDLHKFIQKQKNQILPHKILNKIAIQILHALKYMHTGAQFSYVHADIKALNILFDIDPSKPNSKAFLVDFGLALKVEKDKFNYKPDPKVAGDGTREYASRDLHVGAKPTYRGDLEILFYNLVHWATGDLPWMKILEKDKDGVHNMKIEVLKNTDKFLKTAFGKSKILPELAKLGKYVGKMAYEDEIDFKTVIKYFTEVKKFDAVEESEEEEPVSKPVKKGRAKKKEEPVKEATSKPARRGRAKKVISSGEEEEQESEPEEEQVEEPVSKPTRRGRKPVEVQETESKPARKVRAKKEPSPIKYPEHIDTSLSQHDISSSVENSQDSPLIQKFAQKTALGTRTSPRTTAQTKRKAKNEAPSHEIEIVSSEAASNSDKENSPVKAPNTPGKKAEKSSRHVTVRRIKNPVHIECQTTPGLKKRPKIGTKF